MEIKEFQERIRQKKFFHNNGIVLKGMYMLPGKYVQLSELRYAFCEATMSEQELIESLNYLSESGCINMRNIHSEKDTTLADCEFNDIEAKVSAFGIKIVTCVRTDECIKV